MVKSYSNGMTGYEIVHAYMFRQNEKLMKAYKAMESNDDGRLSEEDVRESVLEHATEGHSGPSNYILDFVSLS